MPTIWEILYAVVLTVVWLVMAIRVYPYYAKKRFEEQFPIQLHQFLQRLKLEDGVEKKVINELFDSFLDAFLPRIGHNLRSQLDIWLAHESKDLQDQLGELGEAVGEQGQAELARTPGLMPLINQVARAKEGKISGMLRDLVEAAQYLPYLQQLGGASGQSINSSYGGGQVKL